MQRTQKLTQRNYSIHHCSVTFELKDNKIKTYKYLCEEFYFFRHICWVLEDRYYHFAIMKVGIMHYLPIKYEANNQIVSVLWRSL
jgi:hypothetical protein